MTVDSVLDQRTLREIYLTGFEIAVKEGKPKTIMSSYNPVNGTYANENPFLLKQILRQEWGFDGFVMTDWFATGEPFASHVDAIAAGNDLIMPGTKRAEKEIRRAVQTGQLSEEAVQACARNVLRGILNGN